VEPITGKVKGGDTMRFCPECGRPVKLANKVGDNIINEESKKIEYLYTCPTVGHNWLEGIDPSGGPTIYKEVV
jgi:hypothetical protein